MAQGLQLWDSSGNIQLDTSTETTTFLTKLSVTEPNKTTYFTDTSLTEGTPFYIITPMNTPYSPFITVSITGNQATIVTKPIPSNWSSGLGGKWAFEVYIGVF